VAGVDTGCRGAANRPHPGPGPARPYEAGLVYNAELERLRVQEALGWRAGAAARPAGVEVVMRGRDGQPLAGLDVTAILQRPATEQGRMELVLRETAPGVYAADQSLSGAWDVRIDAGDGAGRSFVAERRLSWP
ncbi:MAG: FixH family protein, partial [Brevundimonas sp.]|nr:FixH family protein [Brevundimonas sp.]